MLSWPKLGDRVVIDKPGSRFNGQTGSIDLAPGSVIVVRIDDRWFSGRHRTRRRHAFAYGEVKPLDPASDPIRQPRPTDP